MYNIRKIIIFSGFFINACGPIRPSETDTLDASTSETTATTSEETTSKETTIQSSSTGEIIECQKDEDCNKK